MQGNYSYNPYQVTYDRTYNYPWTSNYGPWQLTFAAEKFLNPNNPNTLDARGDRFPKILLGGSR